MTYAWLATHWMKKAEGDGQAVPMWKTAAAGLIAASVGPITNCPMDVAKTRLQAQVVFPGQVPKYVGFFGTMKTVYKEEGMTGTPLARSFPLVLPVSSYSAFLAPLLSCVAALWKGLTPRLARVAPGQAIMWTVVGQVTTFFEQRALADMAAHKF
jgi:solute carrier family 25 (mitochondrial citrate transporter), member 1